MDRGALSNTKSKYSDYAKSNRLFLKNISRHRKESEYIDMTALKRRIQSVSAKIKQLSTEEKQEWVEIKERKIREMHSFFPQGGSTVSLSKEKKSQQYSKVLREALHMLVGVCDSNNLSYDSDMIANVIQEFYYGFYREEVLQQMQSAGYNTSRFKVLHYEQPSFFNSLCCCWEQSSRVD